MTGKFGSTTLPNTDYFSPDISVVSATDVWKLRTCEGSQSHRRPITISKAYPKNWARKKFRLDTVCPIFPNFFPRYPSTKSAAVQVYGRQRRYQKFLISYVFLSPTPTKLCVGEVWCRIPGLPTLTGNISVNFYTIKVKSSSNSRPDEGLSDAPSFTQIGSEM